MYILIRKDSEKEVVAKYSELEKEILKVIALSSSVESGLTCKLVKAQSVAQVVSDAWDLDLMRKVMGSTEMNLDTERLPLGRLQRDQIFKCYKILSQIAKIILSGEKGKENVINSLSMDFYSIIPHNHGVRKPTMIDHLLRIKDKIRMLETLGHIQAT
jgi:hypothetical protein